MKKNRKENNPPEISSLIPFRVAEQGEIERNELNAIFSFFIEHTLTPVAIFDTEMRHKFANAAWKHDNKLGDEGEFIGKTHYEVYLKQPPLWKEQHQRALNGETVKWGPTQLDNYHDETIWYEGTMVPWYALDGSIGGIIIHATIVTETIKNEIKLKEAIKNISHSNKALEHSNKTLDRFAYICSHDLKEPLRSISNFIQLLFTKNIEHFDEESLLYMRHTFKSIDRMDALIKDILSYSETTDHSANQHTILNVKTLAHEIKDSFEYRLNEIGAQLNIGVLPTISGKNTQINQLFTNLISNAIKFRSEKPLVIDIFAIEHDESWEFHVRDNGIGIDKEHHESVFTMFKRLHSKSQYEGSGIGLATCKRIVNDHGGEIHVESAPEGGSDFVFTLPKINI